MLQHMASSQHKLNTARRVVDFLGGPEEVAAWLRVPVSDVTHWCKRGELGRQYALHFYRTLQTMEVNIDAKPFGVDTWSEFIHPLVRPVSSKRPQKSSWRKNGATRGL